MRSSRQTSPSPAAIVWNGPVTRQVNVQDTANDFAAEFKENQATVTWSAKSSSGFSFTSSPGNFSTSLPEGPGVNGVTAPLNFFAEVGHERNGIFFRGGGGAAARPVHHAHVDLAWMGGGRVGVRVEDLDRAGIEAVVARPDSGRWRGQGARGLGGGRFRRRGIGRRRRKIHRGGAEDFHCRSVIPS